MAITGTTSTAAARLKRHCRVPVKALHEGRRRRADARNTVGLAIHSVPLSYATRRSVATELSTHPRYSDDTGLRKLVV